MCISSVVIDFTPSNFWKHHIVQNIFRKGFLSSFSGSGIIGLRNDSESRPSMVTCLLRSRMAVHPAQLRGRGKFCLPHTSIAMFEPNGWDHGQGSSGLRAVSGEVFDRGWAAAGEWPSVGSAYETRETDSSHRLRRVGKVASWRRGYGTVSHVDESGSNLCSSGI